VAASFGFVQMEFGFLLGPGDGRYVVRARADGEPEAVLVFSTLGAPERRRLRGRKGAAVTDASAEPVPTNRVTVVKADEFGSANEAERWLADIRDEAVRQEVEVDNALRVLNRALHAHRVSRGDPHARDVSVEQALVIRIGFGLGDRLVEGRYGDALELPRHDPTRVRRSMEAPEQRFAALVGARERVLACEELVLRARMDVDASRWREAALQARVALESLLTEMTEIPGDRRGGLEADRVPIGEAANAALGGELSVELEAAVEGSVERMESALRARRLHTAS
jgi:hypothetical protein